MNISYFTCSSSLKSYMCTPNDFNLLGLNFVYGTYFRLRLPTKVHILPRRIFVYALMMPSDCINDITLAWKKSKYLKKIFSSLYILSLNKINFRNIVKQYTKTCSSYVYYGYTNVYQYTCNIYEAW